MRYLLVSTALVGVLSLAAPAAAADLMMMHEEPGVVVVDPPAGWTGVYVGVEGGYGAGTTNWENIYGTYEGGPDDVDLGHLTDFSLQGMLGGIVVGADMQMGQIVLGVAGSIDLSNISGSGECEGDSGYFATCSTDLKWLGDLTGRVGLAVNDSVLIYAKGGLAIGAFDYNVGDFDFDAPNYDTTSVTKLGGVIGVGVEAMVTETISAKLEGDWYGFGSKETAFSQDEDPSAYSAPFATDIDESLFVVKAGLNMRF